MGTDAFWGPRDELSRRTIRCAPYPARWKQFSKQYKLKWKAIPFRQSAKSSVPNKKGIYCFLVRHELKSIPPIGYPLYVGVVGIAEGQRSERSLQVRYSEYLRDKDREGARPNVRKFLKAFEGELTFMCAVTNIAPAELKKLETSLNDALMPHYSIKDFSAEVRGHRSAW